MHFQLQNLSCKINRIHLLNKPLHSRVNLNLQIICNGYTIERAFMLVAHDIPCTLSTYHVSAWKYTRLRHNTHTNWTIMMITFVYFFDFLSIRVNVIKYLLWTTFIIENTCNLQIYPIIFGLRTIWIRIPLHQPTGHMFL